MATFRNLKTGNIVKSDNQVSIDLMSRSDNYVPYTPVKSAAKGKGKGKAGK